MTLKQIQAVFDDVSYPGITFEVRRRVRDVTKRGMVKVDLDAEVIDSRDPDFYLTIRRTFEILPDSMTPDTCVQVAFREIVNFLAHEAAERFRFKGDLIHDPHVHGDPYVSVRL